MHRIVMQHFQSLKLQGELTSKILVTDNAEVAAIAMDKTQSWSVFILSGWMKMRANL